MAGERINQAEFARRMGVSKVAIGKWVKRGVIALDESGLLDPDQARAAIAAVSNPAHGAARGTLAAKIVSAGAGAALEAAVPALEMPKGTPSATSEYMRAKTERETYAAANEKLRWQEGVGLLVSRAAVESAWFSIARQAQEALRAIPERLAGVLAAETDPNRVQQLMDDEIRAVIAHIAAAQPAPAAGTVPKVT